MLNIISKSYNTKITSGPKKVVDNLIKGLDEIAYPYVINQAPDACRRLWIHDDARALPFVNKLPQTKILVGPNIAFDGEYRNIVLLQPSEWSKNFCTTYKYNSGPVDVWPTGIDTDQFCPQIDTTQKTHVLVYFKERYEYELEQVTNILQEKNIAYTIIRYGSYTESEYLHILSTATYGIWIGRQESQGIALQEALSSGLPLLVWDVTSIGHWNPSSKKQKQFFSEEELLVEDTTSAPYFSSECGAIISSPNELRSAIEMMEKEYTTFTPRAYVLENLSLKRQALALLSLFEKHYGLTIASGYTENRLNNAPWVYDRGLYKWMSNMKETIKIVYKKINTR